MQLISMAVEWSDSGFSAQTIPGASRSIANPLLDALI
jgi:hypothetical protein